MKNIVFTFVLFALLISCNEKKSAEKQEAEKPTIETEVEKETPEDKAVVLTELKTKTGKIFIVKEDKSSASLSKVTITPKGFEHSKEVIQMEESDPVSNVFIADVNNDGFDELYIVTTGVGSGSYGTIYGFSSNSDKSVTDIYVPEITGKQLENEFKGYMGHDNIYLSNNKLYRKFPIYKKDDSNANPTGGEKILEYDLKQGEASWILEIKN